MVRFVSPLPLILSVFAFIAQFVEADQVDAEPSYARLANMSVQSRLRGTESGPWCDDPDAKFEKVCRDEIVVVASNGGSALIAADSETWIVFWLIQPTNAKV